MKILLFMCREGLGHISRCLALEKEFLVAGHEVYFGAYGHSKKLVEKTGYQAYEIPPEIKLVLRFQSMFIKPWFLICLLIN